MQIYLMELVHKKYMYMCPINENFIVLILRIHTWIISFIVKNNPQILRNISAVIKFKCFLKNSWELAIYYVHILASLCLVINCGIINS